jgi:hypothetical protein
MAFPGFVLNDNGIAFVDTQSVDDATGTVHRFDKRIVYEEIACRRLAEEE